MAEYIGREAVDSAAKEYPWYSGLKTVLKRIPAADVRPVVRGKWKRVVDFTGVEAFGFKETMVVGCGCNVCGYEVDVSEGGYNFCPNCGCAMEVDK